MPPGRKQTRARRAFTLTLDEDLAEMVENVQQIEGFDTPAGAVRHLLRASQAATPEDGLMRSIRLRAYEEVKRVTLTRVTEALHQLCREMEDAARKLGTGGED